MKRREFISLVGGAAAWSITARAQQPTVPVGIGFLHSASPGPSDSLVVAFRQGLSETGYIDGQNVAIEYRWAEGEYDPLPALAADLMSRRVTAIFAGGPPGSACSKGSDRDDFELPLSTGLDPVKLGVVASLNRPGGNATGIYLFTTTLEPKKLELLHELVPKAAVIGVLVNPTNPNTETVSKKSGGGGTRARTGDLYRERHHRTRHRHRLRSHRATGSWRTSGRQRPVLY